MNSLLLSPHEYQMRHFDALPQKLREFLAGARMNYSAADVYDLYKDCGLYSTIATLAQEEKKYAPK